MKREVFSFAVAVAAVCGANASSITYSAASSDGCDYTNGVVTVSVTAVSAASGDQLRLNVISPAGVTNTMYKAVSATGDYAFSTPTLASGVKYAYTVDFVNSSGVAIEGAAQLSGTLLMASDANWFSVSAATDVPTGGAWDVGKKPEIVDSKYNLTNGTEYIFSATTSKSASARVVSEVQFRGGFDEYELSEELEALALSSPQGGITLECDDLGVLSWRGLSRDGSGLAWVELFGVPVDTSVVYRIVIDVDYSSSPSVSYLVAAGAGDYVRLADASGAVWFPCPTASGTAVSGLKYIGAGSLASLEGSYADSNLATVDGTGYATLAAALDASSSGHPAVLKTNVSWAPTQGTYYFDANGKSVSYSAPEGWYVSVANGVMRAIDHAVAMIGETGYGFLDAAFGAAVADDTVTLLTNVVCDVALTTPEAAVTLDLAGCFLKMAADMTVPATGSLDVTNSTSSVGGFGGTTVTVTSGGAFTVSGGSWENNTTYAGNLRSGVSFVAGAPVLVDSIEYNYTVAGSSAASGAVAIPMSEDSEVVATAIVNGDWVTAHVAGANLATPEGRAAAATALNGTGANGFTLLESYVLGLTPETATSKPVVKMAGNGSAGAGTLRLSVADSVAVNTAAGVPVSFTVTTSSDPSDFSGGTTSDPSATGVFDLPLSTTGAKVQYYRVNVAFGE